MQYPASGARGSRSRTLLATAILDSGRTEVNAALSQGVANPCNECNLQAIQGRPKPRNTRKLNPRHNRSIPPPSVQARPAHSTAMCVCDNLEAQHGINMLSTNMPPLKNKTQACHRKPKQIKSYAIVDARQTLAPKTRITCMYCRLLRHGLKTQPPVAGK